MQFWFAHGSDVTIRERLVTQVVLEIRSDHLAPGQRLPSTRDVALSAAPEHGQREISTVAAVGARANSDVRGCAAAL